MESDQDKKLRNIRAEFLNQAYVPAGSLLTESQRSDSNNKPHYDTANRGQPDFDNYRNQNPYAQCFIARTTEQKENIRNDIQQEELDGSVLHESRIDLDDSRPEDDFLREEMLSKSILLSNSFIETSPIHEHNYRLMDSVISLGLEANIYQKPISVAKDLNFLSKQLQNTNKELIRGNNRFRDAGFRPEFQSIKGTAQNMVPDKFKTAIWHRLTDIYKGKEISLFGKGVSPNDIEQGELGNCYFLAVAACLAQYPSRLKRLFLGDQQVNKNGVYGIMLCNSGIWIENLIDDRIPCFVVGNKITPAFIRNKNGNIWGMILEKAWAKLIGGYFSIASGTCAEGMHLLTGAPVTTVRVGASSLAEVTKQICAYNMRNYLMTASSHGDFDEQTVGLLRNHAYSVIGVIFLRPQGDGRYQIEYNYDEQMESSHVPDLQANQVTVLYRLRNPWAMMDRWRGKWSFSDPVWKDNPWLLPQLGLEKEEDRSGIVLLEAAEFYQRFIEFDVCKYEDEFKYTYWNLSQTKGEPEFFEVDVKVAGRHTFAISQINPRILPAINQIKYVLSRVSLVLFHYTSLDQIKYIEGLSSSRLNTFIELENLTPGKYILMTTTHWKTEIVQACLSCYSPEPVLLNKLHMTRDERFDLLSKLYISRASQTSNKSEDVLRIVPHIDPNIGYKHQILEDGFGFFFFVNFSNTKTVKYRVELMAMDNLDFAYPHNRIADMLDIELSPNSRDIRVYMQVDVPNRIKFKLGESKEIPKIDSKPNLDTITKLETNTNKARLDRDNPWKFSLPAHALNETPPNQNTESQGFKKKSEVKEANAEDIPDEGQPNEIKSKVSPGFQASSPQRLKKGY